MPPNPQKIIDLANAYFDSCTLFAGLEVNLFGHLAAHGGSTAEQIAEALQLDPRGAGLLLDAAAAVGLLEKKGEGYSNSADASMFLAPGSPGDLSRAILYNRDIYPAWGRLSVLAQTGKPVEAPELHLGEDKERTKRFVHSMHYRALGMGRAVVPQLELSGRRRLLDVGGGPGTYSVLITAAHPGLSSVVLDLPPVVAIAAELIAHSGAQDRVQTLAGDYHTTPFPAGNDAVNFFGMLHQESPDSIRDLMRRAFDSMEPGGIVHVMDMMTDETHTAPKFSALFAVTMALTTYQGWVFSDRELKGWMEEAGFVDFRVKPLPPPMPHWLAIARKPS